MTFSNKKALLRGLGENKLINLTVKDPWVAALLSHTFDELEASQVDPQTASYLLHTAHRWAVEHLDIRLRSLEFMGTTA